MILQFTKIIEINQLKTNLCIPEWYREHPEKEAKVHHVLYVTPPPKKNSSVKSVKTLMVHWKT